MLSEDAVRDVYVQSAIPLVEEEKKSLLTAVPQLTSANVVYEVRPEIIGGIIIRDGSKIIDLSVRGSLDTIVQSLIWN